MSEHGAYKDGCFCHNIVSLKRQTEGLMYQSAADLLEVRDWYHHDVGGDAALQEIDEGEDAYQRTWIAYDHALKALSDLADQVLLKRREEADAKIRDLQEWLTEWVGPQYQVCITDKETTNHE